MSEKYILGNCIEKMDELKTASIDMVFADPPYYLQLKNFKFTFLLYISEFLILYDTYNQIIYMVTLNTCTHANKFI